MDLIAILGEVDKDFRAHVISHGGDPVAGSHLIYERIGSHDGFIEQFPRQNLTVLHDQDRRQRSLDRFKVRDLLFDIVFEDLEVLLLEPGDEVSPAVLHGDVDSNLLYLESDRRSALRLGLLFFELLVLFFGRTLGE